MKVKTSIIISVELVRAVDRVAPQWARSDFFEKAIWKYLELLDRGIRDRKDLEILDLDSAQLNAVARDVLSYQEAL
ncbi:MAG: hypothetical protein WCL50_05375 [Spirochaetota bacterium]